MKINEKICLEYAKKLPKITEYQKKYAIRNLPVTYFYCRKKYYNGDIGESVKSLPNNEKECQIARHKKVTVCFSYTIISVFKGIQVLRTFYVYKYCEVNKKVKYDFYEVYQNWILENGKRIIIGKKLIPLSFSKFELDGEYIIKKTGKNYYSYDYSGCYIFLISRLTKEFNKKGLSLVRNIKDVSLESIFTEIATSNKKETLLKIGLYNSFTKSLNTYDQCIIAKRHNYIPKDFSVWVDNIYLLKKLNKDIRNPKYICPKNLFEQHSILIEKDRKIQEKIREKQRHEEDIRILETIEKERVLFDKKIKRFLELKITDNEIEIKPLKTLEEFQEEGEKMNHCVFSNEYYKIENSLILSAKINGRRIETIEYDILQNKVLQSRGKHNLKTEYHERIIQLMNKLKVTKTSYKILNNE